MFNVNEYVSAMTLNQDCDEELVNMARTVAQNILLLCDDPWLARADFWGMTSASENQLFFNGNSILPSLERKVNQLDPESGVLGESDLRVSWFTNEDKPHVNDEYTAEERLSDTKTRIDNVVLKMRTAAIKYVIFMQEHDKISDDLDQMKFMDIKRSAAAKREATAKQLKAQTA